MRQTVRILALAAVAGALLPAPAAEAGANAPLCLAIANNYNNCMRQFQRGGQHRGWGSGDEYGAYDGRGWNGGYYDEDDEYRAYRQQRRAQRAQANCAIWLAQMQASGCYE